MCRPVLCPDATAQINNQPQDEGEDYMSIQYDSKGITPFMYPNHRRTNVRNACRTDCIILGRSSSLSTSNRFGFITIPFTMTIATTSHSHRTHHHHQINNLKGQSTCYSIGGERKISLDANNSRTRHHVHHRCPQPRLSDMIQFEMMKLDKSHEKLHQFESRMKDGDADNNFYSDDSESHWELQGIIDLTINPVHLIRYNPFLETRNLLVPFNPISQETNSMNGILV